jgi:hypothetical protein
MNALRNNTACSLRTKSRSASFVLLNRYAKRLVLRRKFGTFVATTEKRESTPPWATLAIAFVADEGGAVQAMSWGLD